MPGALPLGESKTALNCRGVSSRFSRPKPRLTTCLDELDSQTLAALGATTRQDLTAVLGGHTSTETVVALALQYAGLERSFHLQIPE